MIGGALRFFKPGVYVGVGALALVTLTGAAGREAWRAMDAERARQRACATRAAEFGRDNPKFHTLVLDVDMAVDKCGALARISPRLVLTVTPQGGLR